MSDTAIEMHGRAEGGVIRDASSAADSVALLKPRVMSPVVITGFTGLMRAPGGPHPVLTAVAGEVSLASALLFATMVTDGCLRLGAGGGAAGVGT